MPGICGILISFIIWRNQNIKIRFETWKLKTIIFQIAYQLRNNSCREYHQSNETYLSAAGRDWTRTRKRNDSREIGDTSWLVWRKQQNLPNEICKSNVRLENQNEVKPFAKLSRRRQKGKNDLILRRITLNGQLRRTVHLQHFHRNILVSISRSPLFAILGSTPLSFWRLIVAFAKL